MITQVNHLTDQTDSRIESANSQKLTARIQELYAAFGRGDISGMIAPVADDVDWEYGGDDRIPWLKHLHGREGALSFFKKLSELDFQTFHPKLFLASGNVVAVIIDFDVIVKYNGKRITEEDMIHLWTFNEAGKISRFRHRSDTLKFYEASLPVAETV